eukprot:jgi/Mesen1/4741/ME000241S03778
MSTESPIILDSYVIKDEEGQKKSNNTGKGSNQRVEEQHTNREGDAVVKSTVIEEGATDAGHTPGWLGRLTGGNQREQQGHAAAGSSRQGEKPKDAEVAYGASAVVSPEDVGDAFGREAGAKAAMDALHGPKSDEKGGGVVETHADGEDYTAVHDKASDVLIHQVDDGAQAGRGEAKKEEALKAAADVKAPGVLHRLKEEVRAVGDAIAGSVKGSR